MSKKISGANHIVLLDENGSLYTLGCGEYGRLGRGVVSSPDPEPIQTVPGQKSTIRFAGNALLLLYYDANFFL
jgi:alpha-tubulin suppressor-like RCC1 family protein